MARAKSRVARYSSDAFDSGWRPSQSRPSIAPPRASARAWGEIRPGGGRRRRGVESLPASAMSGGRCFGVVGRAGGGSVGGRVVRFIDREKVLVVVVVVAEVPLVGFVVPVVRLIGRCGEIRF